MALVLAGLLPASARAADPVWRLEQPPPPGGAPFALPLGTPGDLEFVSPSRALLAVRGNAPTIPGGVFTWNGESWSQLASVCGPATDRSAIAVAGPREFWTITAPSRPRAGDDTSLCHFKDGRVVDSYSTPLESSDPYRAMSAAGCLSASDCWFGGPGAEDVTGERRGAFHLHWDGVSLNTVYAPQSRRVTDIEAHQGRLFETVGVGKSLATNDPPDLFEPEVQPRLVHEITGASFSNDPFAPAGCDCDMLALNSDGEDMWAGGGGRASGPSSPDGAPRPVAARLVDGVWQEVPLAADALAPNDRIVDIAAVPGADYAWAAVAPANDNGSPSSVATVARIDPDGTVTKVQLPASGAGRGAAAKIAFSSPVDGWMVTTQGWLFHFTDDAPLPRDTDPAYGSLIDFRPNEAAEQFVPDTPPADDSELFKPPPIELASPPPPAKVRRLPALMRKVNAKVKGHTLVVRFLLTRKARVSLLAHRKGRVVARSKPKMMRPGRHAIVLKLDPKRWPKRLSFRTKEPGQPAGGGGGGDTPVNNGDVITTGLR